MECGGLQSVGTVDISPELIAFLCGLQIVRTPLVAEDVRRRLHNAGLLSIARCATIGETPGRP